MTMITFLLLLLTNLIFNLIIFIPLLMRDDTLVSDLAVVAQLAESILTVCTGSFLLQVIIISNRLKGRFKTQVLSLLKCYHYHRIIILRRLDC